MIQNFGWLQKISISTLMGLFRVATVREKSGKNKNFSRSGKSQGKSQFLSKSGKSQGILFSHLVTFMKTFSFGKLSCRLCGFGFKGAQSRYFE